MRTFRFVTLNSDNPQTQAEVDALAEFLRETLIARMAERRGKGTVILLALFQVLADFVSAAPSEAQRQLLTEMSEALVQQRNGLNH